MVDYSKINSFCKKYLQFYYGHVDRLYAPELQEKTRKELLEEKLKVEVLLEKEITNNNMTDILCSYYFVRLYMATYLEDKLSDEQFQVVVDSLLNEAVPDCNLLNPMILLLLSDKDLSEGQVTEIYHKILTSTIFQEYFKFGNMPYDYRYHILKQANISPELEAEIYLSYDNMDIEELLDMMQEVIDDVNGDLRKYKIKDIDEINHYPSLKKDYHYILKMKQYYQNRVNKQKIV